MIYALDPVYGAVFARLLLGESEALGTQGLVGAGLVTSAAVFATFWARASEEKGGENEVEMQQQGEEPQ